MVTKVEYKIKTEPNLYPLHCDLDSLDMDKLKKFIEAAQDFIQISEQAEILISFSDHYRLLDINRAISQEIHFGADELEAVMMISYKHNLPLHTVFYAYSLKKNYQFAYEKYIYASVIKILSDMGFKPMQIYRHINSLPHQYYTYRQILEVLKGWKDGDFAILSFMKKSGNAPLD